MKLDSIQQLREEFESRGLTPPANLKPEDRDFPVIMEAAFPEERTNRPFFADAVLQVAWGPNQDPKPFVVRSNLNGAGAVALCVVGGKVLFTRQWRVNLGRYTWEVPRGFSEKWDSGKETTKDTLPKGLQTAIREAHEEVANLAGAKITTTYLGKVAENSGTHIGEPAIWLLELEGFAVDPANTSIQLVTATDALKLAEDAHTCAALVKYLATR